MLPPVPTPGPQIMIQELFLHRGISTAVSRKSPKLRLNKGIQINFFFFLLPIFNLLNYKTLTCLSFHLTVFHEEGCWVNSTIIIKDFDDISVLDGIQRYLHHGYSDRNIGYSKSLPKAALQVFNFVVSYLHYHNMVSRQRYH